MEWIKLSDREPEKPSNKTFRRISTKEPLWLYWLNMKLVEFKTLKYKNIEWDDIEWLDESEKGDPIIVPYQRCPICDGKGFVSSQTPSMSLFDECSVCEGKKIIQQGLFYEE